MTRRTVVVAALLVVTVARAGDVEVVDPRLDALVPRDARFETVVEGRAWVEGPVWLPGGTLLFTDIPANAVLAWREGEPVRVHLERAGYTGSASYAGRERGANGLALDGAGRLVLCEHGDRRVTRLAADGTKQVIADRWDGKRFNSPNDVVVRANGEVWFTDPPFGLPRTFDDPARELPFAGVYRVPPDGAPALATRDLSAPNGLAFSPDERTLYVANADRKRPVWTAFPVRDDGTLGAGRAFADASAWVGRFPGSPDGLKVDATGNVFATGPGGVYVFAPDGTHLGTLRTGVATSNVAFGGSDGAALYVTATTRVLRLRTTTRGAHRPAAQTQ
jgi:gluconolactonase